MLAHLIEKAGPDVSRAAGDYGTRFVAAAGMVNLLAMLDAYGIALGRRTDGFSYGPRRKNPLSGEWRPALEPFRQHVAFALLFRWHWDVSRSGQRQKGRVKYAAWSFALFIGVALAIAWLMYPFSR